MLLRADLTHCSSNPVISSKARPAGAPGWRTAAFDAQAGKCVSGQEALKERGILRQSAPHLVSKLAFIVPNYDWWEALFYGLGPRRTDSRRRFSTAPTAIVPG